MPDPVDSFLTTDDILGKDVIDASGSFLGVVDKLFVDPDLIQITGISIDKGFLKNGFHVGVDTIKEIRDHAIFLKITPAATIRRMRVFDIDGKIIGTVKNVITLPNRNTIKEIIVKSHLFGKVLHVTPDFIKLVGDNVLLNIKKADLKGRFQEMFRSDKEE